MPTETRFVRTQRLTREASYVVPLDELRSVDNVTTTIVSGTSGILYTIASGKEAYLTQAMFSELSGTASVVQLNDTRGSGLTVRIPCAANTVITYDANYHLGPITSGITIQSPQFGGDITLLVEIDPKMEE